MGIDEALPNRMVQSITHTSVVKIAKTIDEYVLAFFGSEEELKKYIHLFVLETETPGMITHPEGNNIRIEMHVNYRLRLKTAKELGYGTDN
jgi:hypothetical protein